MKIKIILFLAIAVLAFAAKDSLYEINGTVFDKEHGPRGPKAIVKVSRTVPRMKPLRASEDSFQVSLKRGGDVRWLEMEKNTVYSICVDDDDGFWKVEDFKYEKEGSSCIRLHSGNYVKNGKIQYATRMGNGFTFQLLIGMKYIDLRGKKHQLGFLELGEGFYYKEGLWYPIDPERFEVIDKVLAVDKYMVTECEFVQALWDSIPAQVEREYQRNHPFWIEKKKTMTKNGFCDAHDSAAVRVNLYYALVYANLRSLRDGFQSVYSFEWTDNGYGLADDGSLVIPDANFHVEHSAVRVRIDTSANGYRLPYYDEWMALGRAGHSYTFYVWGRDGDSAIAARHAWFGVRDPEDKFLRMNRNDWNERSRLERSCGKWLQKSRPVGMLKPNGYGLYDMFGLVCENVIMEKHQVYFPGVAATCKGGFLTDTLKALTFKAKCETDFFDPERLFQGLRLVRQIK